MRPRVSKDPPRITIEPHAEHFRAPVAALNERMRPGGRWGFFEEASPAWLPYAPGATPHREYLVAHEDGVHVRGGYVLKHEQAFVAGSMRAVASVQGPYTEGAADPRYAPVVFEMIKDMLARQPLLYEWGLEASKNPILTLFRAVGWINHGSPLLFWRPERPRSAAAACEAERVASFGSWADEVWRRAAAAYDFAALRDSAALGRLYPPANERFHRLMIRDGDRVLGWAVAGANRFEDHPALGSGLIGALWDCFAHPSDAGAVIECVQRHLASLGVDAVLASLNHSAWIAAGERCGFLAVPNQRNFLVSRPLAAALAPFRERAPNCFLTFGDGESYATSPRFGQALFGPV